MRTEWKHGDQKRLAKKADTSPQYLSDILAKRKRASPELARRIAEEAQKLGYALGVMDLLYPNESQNPLMG